MFSTSIDSITENFPHLILKRIVGKPNRENLIKLQKQVYENLTSFETTIGGGNHGYLGLEMSPEKYLTTTGHNFERPENPGLTPIIPLGAT